MYSGESGSRMRRAGRPAPIGPASRLNSGRKADWLPLVRAMLRAVTCQPSLAPEESGQGVGEVPIALRSAVQADGPLERPFAPQQPLHVTAERPLPRPESGSDCRPPDS